MRSLFAALFALAVACTGARAQTAPCIGPECKTIHALPPSGGPALSDEIPMWSIGASATQKATWTQIQALIASSGVPGGSPGQLQWNSAGAFAGLTISGDCTIVASTGVMTCGSIGGKAFALGGPLTFANLTTPGDVLVVTSAGNVGQAAPTGSPGGSNLQVQYNNSGAFGGMTAAQLTALVNTFSPSLAGTVPASLGGHANVLWSDGWGTAPTGGGPPTGAAGGGLAGTYPNPSLAATAVTPGSYGGASNVPAFTVNAAGQLIAASNATGTAATVPGAVYNITNSAYGCTTVNTDNGACINSAIVAANAAGGGNVLVPAGAWNLTTQIVVLPHVNLVCANGADGGYDQTVSDGSSPFAYTLGSIFHVNWGSGADTMANAAIQVRHSAGVTNCGSIYPGQSLTASTPTAYGPFIACYDTVANTDQWAENNWTLNAYDFISCKGSNSGVALERATLTGNTGSPIAFGISVDWATDWLTISGNRFNSFDMWRGNPSNSTGLQAWANANGELIHLGYGGWYAVGANQAFGYQGMVVIDFASACCGGFVAAGPVTIDGLHADACGFACVWWTGTVQNLKITNSTMTAYNLYTSVGNHAIADFSTASMQSLQMDDNYIYGPTTAIISLGGTLGNATISHTHAQTTTAMANAFAITTGGNVFFDNNVTNATAFLPSNTITNLLNTAHVP